MQRMTEATEARALHVRHLIVARFRRRIAAKSKALVIPGILLAALAASSAYSQAPAKIGLKGIVKGQDGQPKPYVLVDILGPSRIYTQADASGQFEAKLLPGAYVIRIREGRRRMEFSRQFKDGVNTEPFKLRW